MSDYEGYSEKYRVKVRQEIQDVYNITSFDQEQAEKEIGQLIDSKKLPNYLLDKGQYKYDGNINSVYFRNEFELRSQPNSEARVIDQGYGGHQENYFAIYAYDYLGEWTHPNGNEWVIIKTEVFRDDTSTMEIGFAPKKEAEAHFVTNEQLKSFVNVLEILAGVGEAALLEIKYYVAEIEKLEEQNAELTRRVTNLSRSSWQETQRQVQELEQRSQQRAEQVYQCSKCGERVVKSSAAKLPSGPCYNEKGKWSMLGQHIWNRLQ